MSDMMYYRNKNMGLDYRYRDTIKPAENRCKDKRSGTEIAMEVIRNAGLKLEGKEDDDD